MHISAAGGITYPEAALIQGGTLRFLLNIEVMMRDKNNSFLLAFIFILSLFVTNSAVAQFGSMGGDSSEPDWSHDDAFSNLSNPELDKCADDVLRDCFEDDFQLDYDAYFHNFWNHTVRENFEIYSYVLKQCMYVVKPVEITQCIRDHDNTPANPMF